MTSANRTGRKGTCAALARCLTVVVSALCLMVLARPLPAQSLPEVSITGTSHQLLRAPAEFVRLDSGVDSLDALRARMETGLDWQKLTDRDVNQGLTDDAYWLRVRLVNAGDEPVDWVLHHETSYLDYLGVHIADAGEDFTSRMLSDRRPFNDRPVDYRRLAFRHTTPAGSHTDLYLYLAFMPEKADAMSLNLHLYEESAFEDSREREGFLYGLFYGNSLSLMIVALVLALTLRHRVYAYYFLMVAGTAVFWLKLNGYGFQFLWQDNPWWHNQGFHLCFLAMCVLAVQFTRAFLGTQAFLPRLDLLMRWYVRIAVLAGALRLVGVYETVLILSALYILLLGVLPVIGWLAWRRGVKHGLLFAGAWMIYSITLLVSLFSAYTPILHWGMEPLVFAQLGSVLENLILLFATARRVMTLEEDRRRAMSLATTDPLTGLGNRRMLSEQYQLLKQLHRRAGSRVYFMLVDLDHFKEINDTHGHAAGDRVLVEVATLFEEISRRTDVCVRYGGEEFAILMTADSRKAAGLFAERLRTRFEQQVTVFRGVEIRHTLSIGVTTVFEGPVTLSEKSMIHRADQALYRAKEQGRNRVEFWSEGLEDGRQSQ